MQEKKFLTESERLKSKMADMISERYDLLEVIEKVSYSNV